MFGHVMSMCKWHSDRTSSHIYHNQSVWTQIRPRDYKTFCVLNSIEYEVSTAHKKLKRRQIKKFLALILSEVVCLFVCLFDLILYVPVNNLSVMSGRVFLG